MSPRVSLEYPFWVTQEAAKSPGYVRSIHHHVGNQLPYPLIVSDKYWTSCWLLKAPQDCSTFLSHVVLIKSAFWELNRHEWCSRNQIAPFIISKCIYIYIYMYNHIQSLFGWFANAHFHHQIRRSCRCPGPLMSGPAAQLLSWNGWFHTGFHPFFEENTSMGFCGGFMEV